MLAPGCSAGEVSRTTGRVPLSSLDPGPATCAHAGRTSGPASAGVDLATWNTPATVAVRAVRGHAPHAATTDDAAAHPKCRCSTRPNQRLRNAIAALARCPHTPPTPRGRMILGSSEVGCSDLLNLVRCIRLRL